MCLMKAIIAKSNRYYSNGRSQSMHLGEDERASSEGFLEEKDDEGEK